MREHRTLDLILIAATSLLDRWQKGYVHASALLLKLFSRTQLD
jgi:hypothetical protein